jgi:hypothetical protein
MTSDRSTDKEKLYYGKEKGTKATHKLLKKESELLFTFMLKVDACAPSRADVMPMYSDWFRFVRSVHAHCSCLLFHAYVPSRPDLLPNGNLLYDFVLSIQVHCSALAYMWSVFAIMFLSILERLVITPCACSVCHPCTC